MKQKYEKSYSAGTHEPTMLRLVFSYNPIVTTTLNRSVGVKRLKHGGVERAPFLGEYNRHSVIFF